MKDVPFVCPHSISEAVGVSTPGHQRRRPPLAARFLTRGYSSETPFGAIGVPCWGAKTSSPGPQPGDSFRSPGHTVVRQDGTVLLFR
jgi:hypothetical protein